jgi:hypothetical protein
MAGNRILSKAKASKKDEFYTQLSDIERELRHYKDFFKDKVVLCNCDDPFESNFFKYFSLNFNSLGLKKLIATCYATSPVIYTQLTLFDNNVETGKEPSDKKPYKIEITEVTDENRDGRVDLSDVEYLLKNRKNALALLEGDGDFRSAECVELLKQSDIIVTNPPFSLFREYIAQLIEYEKKFIIIGNKNAITYKEIFPLIKDNKLWTGYRPFSGGMWFVADYLGKYEKIVDGVKLINVPAIWFTNFDTTKRHEDVILFKNYNSKNYPKYETFDGIDVNETSDIPCDFYGVMGVPKTFLDKYNPEQFEILGYEREDENIKAGISYMPEEFLQTYRAQGGTGHYTKGMKMLCYYDYNGKAKIPFSRILIRRKQGQV